MTVCDTITLLATNEQKRGFAGNPDFAAFSIIENAIDCGLITEPQAIAIIQQANITYPMWQTWLNKYRSVLQPSCNQTESTTVFYPADYESQRDDD